MWADATWEPLIRSTHALAVHRRPGEGSSSCGGRLVPEMTGQFRGAWPRSPGHVRKDEAVRELPKGATIRRDAGLYGYERALARAGLAPVAGADEAGRGACAGPLVVGACVLPEGKRGHVPGLADSKLLVPATREKVYDRIMDRALAWSVVIIPAADIDRVGLHVCNVA